MGSRLNIFVVAINGQPDAAFARESDAVAYSKRQEAGANVVVVRCVPLYGFNDGGKENMSRSGGFSSLKFR